jgi:hypothetical protein
MLQTMKTLTRQQILTIAGEAGCDPRTVEHVYLGAKSKILVRARIVAAAKKLNIQTPPK